MDQVTFFEDIFESVPDYKKIVLLIFLIKGDKKLIKRIGFSENDINQSSPEFKNILIEQHENYLNFVKDQEESTIEQITIKEWKMK